MMDRAELAGGTVILVVAQVGRGVSGDVGSGISTARLVLRGGRILVRSVEVHALYQHGGQDIEQRQPGT
jgi:hypothetical protein